MLSHTIPWVVWKANLGHLLVLWYKTHLNLTWRAPLQSAAYLSVMAILPLITFFLLFNAFIFFFLTPKFLD